MVFLKLTGSLSTIHRQRAALAWTCIDLLHVQLVELSIYPCPRLLLYDSKVVHNCYSSEIISYIDTILNALLVILFSPCAHPSHQARSPNHHEETIVFPQEVLVSCMPGGP